LFPDYTITPKSNQHKEKAAVHQFIKAREEHRLRNIIPYLDGAKHKNKQGPQKSEPVIF
jgi:hypothetical protein